jgi:diguanylate cyclase (GGDEF)-like protein
LIVPATIPAAKMAMAWSGGTIAQGSGKPGRSYWAMPANDSNATRHTAAIARLGLLERAGDPALTGITRLASYISGAGAAAVHVLDDTHQHRVAGAGAPLGDHPREDSMCRLVVDSEQRIVCADATTDPRFSYSSYVQGDEPVRFYVSVPLRASDGAVFGTLCTFDIVARKLREEQVSLLEDLADQVVAQIELTRVAVELGHVASHDPLTGAVNRLVLGDRLAQAFARRMRHGGDTFLAAIDINHFKTLNDVHGHLAGDQVLVSVAHRLMAAMRAEDTVARIGGDEFVVVAEIDGTPEAAEAVMRRIEAALADPVFYADQCRPVQVSVGGVVAAPGEDIRSLLRRADEAMYARKAVMHAAV